MNKYYTIFSDEIRKGSIERKTILETGAEAIFRSGQLLAATDSTADFSHADLTETVKTEPHLVIFGSGHISKALYDIAVMLKMKTTVLDERKELLTEERFPFAERLIAPFPELLSREYDFIQPYFVILTHGHSFDNDCLRYALSHSYSYIGMIGSKAKSQRALSLMEEEGFPEDKLKSIHTPIGLPINAETPEEIAISIMSEIISVYRKEKEAVIVDPEMLSLMAEGKGIVLRIVEKNGSAPRAKGSAMVVRDGKAYGTIGGGAIEKTATEEAIRMEENDERFLLKHYNLTANGDLGMVCGGNETILFTSLADK